MKRLRPLVTEGEETNVQRIVSVCAAEGYTISPSFADEIWSDYSDSMCASWMTMPERDSDLLRIVSARVVSYS